LNILVSAGSLGNQKNILAAIPIVMIPSQRKMFLQRSSRDPIAGTAKNPEARRPPKACAVAAAAIREKRRE